MPKYKSDGIVSRFRGRFSSDDLAELQRELHRLEEELTAQAGGPEMATDPAEPASERQRKAMFAAARGESDLGIPQKVGKELTSEWGESHDGKGRWGGRARPGLAGDDPAPFVGQPLTGGQMLNSNLKPYSPQNAKRSERVGSAMAGDAARSFAALFPHASRLRTV
jgi:hypothetical protein